MMSAGIRSGVNWMRENFRFKHSAERAHQQRLAQPGHAFEQTWPPANQGDKHLLDQFFMADDDARHLGFEFIEGRCARSMREFNLVDWIPW